MSRRILPALMVASLLSIWSASAVGQKVHDKKAAEESKAISKAIGKSLNYSESKWFTWATAWPASRAKSIAKSVDKACGLFAEHGGLGDNWRSLWGDQKPIGVITPAKSGYRKFNKWYGKKYREAFDPDFAKRLNKQAYWQVAGSRLAAATSSKPWGIKYNTQTMVHLAGHLCVQRHAYHNNFSPPWLEEGMAVYFEMTVLGRTACGCGGESYGGDDEGVDRALSGTPKSKFEARARREMKTGNLPRLHVVYPKRMWELTRKDVYRSYTTVAWMMSQPKKLAEFIAALKREWPPEINFAYDDSHGKAQDKALEKVFGMKRAAVDQAVETWFIAQGATKKKR